MKIRIVEELAVTGSQAQGFWLELPVLWALNYDQMTNTYNATILHSVLCWLYCELNTRHMATSSSSTPGSTTMTVWWCLWTPLLIPFHGRRFPCWWSTNHSVLHSFLRAHYQTVQDWNNMLSSGLCGSPLLPVWLTQVCRHLPIAQFLIAHNMQTGEKRPGRFIMGERFMIEGILFFFVLVPFLLFECFSF